MPEGMQQIATKLKMTKRGQNATQLRSLVSGTEQTELKPDGVMLHARW